MSSPSPVRFLFLQPSNARRPDQSRGRVGERVRGEPTALIDDALDNFLPDLRFTPKLQGLEVRTELLFEHDSETGRLMPVRFFCETGALWADARRSAITIAQQLLTQGRAEGARFGRAKLLLGVLRRRGFQLTDEQRQRIECCSDENQFEQWAEAVSAASSAAEVLDPPTQH